MADDLPSDSKTNPNEASSNTSRSTSRSDSGSRSEVSKTSRQFCRPCTHANGCPVQPHQNAEEDDDEDGDVSWSPSSNSRGKSHSGPNVHGNRLPSPPLPSGGKTTSQQSKGDERTSASFPATFSGRITCNSSAKGTNTTTGKIQRGVHEDALRIVPEADDDEDNIVAVIQQRQTTATQTPSHGYQHNAKFRPKIQPPKCCLLQQEMISVSRDKAKNIRLQNDDLRKCSTDQGKLFIRMKNFRVQLVDSIKNATGHGNGGN